MKTLFYRTCIWFGIYVIVVLSFSGIYWHLYHSDSRHFRVSQSPFNQTLLAVEDHMRVGRHMRRDLDAELNTYAIPTREIFTTPTDTLSSLLSIEFADLARRFNLAPTDTVRLHNAIDRYRATLHDIFATFEELGRRHAGAFEEIVYEDFVYFSASTISTLGYGDIVPNSTRARRWVFSEILCGLFLTLFFIHFLFRWRRI